LLKHNGADLVGVVDLVGEDFVLDYKTDSEIQPAEHRFQLWAYSTALGKPAAFIAYLRKSHLHKFSVKDLADAERVAHRLVDNIAAGKFDADPSIEKCNRCVYANICASSAAKASVMQLRLFN